MENPNILVWAYAANILILVPCCWEMLFSKVVGRVFEGKVPESRGLRLLVGSLWASILLGSVAGIVHPEMFVPLLMMQVVYKAIWLVSFVAPLVIAGKSSAVPWGISLCFVGIVVIWPVLIWMTL